MQLRLASFFLMWQKYFSFFLFFHFVSFLHNNRFFFFSCWPSQATFFEAHYKNIEKQKKMGTATSTITTNDDVPSNYHTVAICADLPKIDIAVIMSLHWVSRAKRLDTQRGNQMNLITFQAAYHIE